MYNPVDNITILKSLAVQLGSRLVFRYRIGADDRQPAGQPYSTGIETIAVRESEVMSLLGTPVAMPVRINSGRYTSRQKSGEVVSLEYPELLLPPTTLVEITRKKRIVRTSVNGASTGTVKEYIGTDDFEVRLTGMIVSQDDNMPVDYIQDFRAVMEAPVALSVTSELLQWFGIYNLVVDDYSIALVEGYSNLVAYQVRAMSDAPVEIQSNGL